RATGIQAHWIVDPDKKRLLRQRDRATIGALRVERAGERVAGLRGEQPGLELDDLLRLFGRDVMRALRMTERRVVRLFREILPDGGRRRRLPAVPHHGCQEAEIRR